MLEALDADAVRAWSRTTVERLAAHRGEINALNVFPVADSDTGSNLLTTFSSADHAVASVAGPSSAAALLDTMASAAARDAVGNSGFIVSQFLRGLAHAAAGSAVCDAPVLVAPKTPRSPAGRPGRSW